MNKKIQVHVADDHKILVEGITAVLHTENDIKVVDYSLNGKDVLDWFKYNTADILVLDINMPVIGGIDVLKRIKKMENSPQIIVLSSYDDTRFIHEIVSLGARGFLSKSSAGSQIVKAVKTVYSGSEYFSEDVRKDLFKLMYGQKVSEGTRPLDNEGTESLSGREIDTLRLIVQEYSSPEIAEILNLSLNTVTSYRKSLIRKTNVKNTVGLIKFALKHKII